MEIQQEIAGYVAAFSLRNVSEEIRECALRAFTDTVAAILLGAAMEQVQDVAKALDVKIKNSEKLTEPAEKAGFVKAAEGIGETGAVKDRTPTVLGYGHCQAVLTDAVLLNAVSAHSCEYNDLFYGLPGHPSAVLAPVVLGLGERLHKSGYEVLEAYICGFEVLGRINEALMPEHHIRGFHSTSTAGIIGAAMAAGKLLGMTDEELINTCSMACTFACGLRGNFGYTGNSLHVGNAAANGLRAALYVRSGIRAPKDLLDRPDGYIAAFAGNREKLGRLAGLLGKVSVFETPGLLLKKYPTCFSTYQAIEAARQFVREHPIRAEDIEQMECLSSPNHSMSLPSLWPGSIYEQRFCIPFCICWVLAGGRLSAAEFSKAHYEDARLYPFRAKLRYGEETAQRGDKGFGSTLLRVWGKAGQMWEYRTFPNPCERVEGWSEAALREKFDACCNAFFQEAELDRLWDSCRSLTKIEDIAKWLHEYFKGR